MRVAVITCNAYRDALKPFFELFRRFWPNCKCQISLVTDHLNYRSDVPSNVQVCEYGKTWCGNFGQFAKENPEEPILMLQDDFWLNAPANEDLIMQGLELLKDNVGAVRLYPCPGADFYFDDEPFGGVYRSSRYFISCQATIWDPQFIQEIAQCDRTGLARDFELDGTAWAQRYSSRDVMAFRRDQKEWPINYLCTAIVRGQYLPSAKELCDKYSIVADFSRGFAAA